MSRALKIEDRLDHARAAIETYLMAKWERTPTCDVEYEDTDVSDLIADLLHLQNFLGLRDAERTLATARMHFEAEREEQTDGVAA